MRKHTLKVPLAIENRAQLTDLRDAAIDYDWDWLKDAVLDCQLANKVPASELHIQVTPEHALDAEGGDVTVGCTTIPKKEAREILDWAGVTASNGKTHRKFNAKYEIESEDGYTFKRDGDGIRSVDHNVTINRKTLERIAMALGFPLKKKGKK